MICLMQISPAIQLHGTISIGELTRFQYFHTLGWLWPLAVGAALFLGFVVPLLHSRWYVRRGFGLAPNPHERHSIHPVVVIFWVFALGVSCPIGTLGNFYASQIFLREPISTRSVPRISAETDQARPEYRLERLEDRPRNKEPLPAVPSSEYW